MKFSIRKVVTTLGAGAAMSLLMAQSAMAQLGRSDIKAIQPERGSVNLIDVIMKGLNLFLWVVGLLAVIYLIYGGVLYITAGGDAEKANKGRTAITNAVIGIVIVVLALVIFNFAVSIPTGEAGSTVGL
jgi:hypothetical protein